jgi:hypothetical protein
MSLSKLSLVMTIVSAAVLSGCVSAPVREGDRTEQKVEWVKSARVQSTSSIDEVISRRDRETLDRLETVLVDVALQQGAVLEEAVAYMRDNNKIQILVKWTTLENEAFIARDEPLPEIHLQQVSLKAAIEAVLAGVSNLDAELGYEVIDGVVWISTVEDLERKTVVRLHNCSELLSLERPEVSRRELLEYAADLAEQLGGERVTNDLELMRLIVHDLEEGRWERAEELQDLIKSTIAPDTWEPDDVVGSALIWGDILVVRHTRRVQREVAALLEGLRRRTDQP